MNPETFQRILDSAEPQCIFNFEKEFREVIPNFDFQAMVAKEVRNARDYYRKLPRLQSETALTLMSGKWFNINLITFDCKEFASAIFTHNADNISYFLADAEYQLYTLENYQNATFSMSAHARLEQSGSLKRGDFFSTDSANRILSLRADHPVAVLSLSPKTSTPYGWRFDAASGAPVCQWNAFPVVTLVELMAKFLGTYGGPDSIECLQSLKDHDSDTVKWQAAVSLACIDRAAGLAAFADLARSANPMIAAAAAATLEQTKQAA
ncbi:hypothetical protein [Duganella sp. Root1480D1]|uniref:hypothetical protein n=1 Tax=Duganella sp. Root1480D1 TaxID=1736471 RepID=UPI00070ED470|nr:hypothetical protein [Duganella sp. Root1480D1]KQZ42253.1 hypothetical protein ASD58_25650 [Duganella sp. Root1480D1]